MPPRDDLLALGVNYRRIPVLAIGKDIYCDSRLILQKLEELFPAGGLSADTPEQRATERLLQTWSVEGGVFWHTAFLVPAEIPLDEKFLKDRKSFAGINFSQEARKEQRPAAIAGMRSSLHFLESTLLADGRDFISKTEKPSLADIECKNWGSMKSMNAFIAHYQNHIRDRSLCKHAAIWPLCFISRVPNALPEDDISSEEFPKVFAWLERFNTALSSAESALGKPTTLAGAEAIKKIATATFAEGSPNVDANDPLRLKACQEIEFWPTDTGSTHHVRGKLVKLTADEVAVAVPTKSGDEEVRIHAPRHGFHIAKADVSG
ncbi:MAG: hypothetical protein M1819_004483 [Sarea resinae]|nr:MAG: hypothetical protein M1819_004483 [Sarea resinae]